MAESYVVCIITGILLSAVLAAAAVFACRSRKSRKKVMQMPCAEKLSTLEALAAPFGFAYVPEKEIFTSRHLAWQRSQGYEVLYDQAAEHFHMILDTWPVYFDYDGKTWLIEFWKGQYGINTGAEIGVYHADRILPEEKRRFAHYDAAENSELPVIQFCLEKKGVKIASLKSRHWWLTAFRMGEFSRPGDLRMMASVTFRENGMAESFYGGLLKSGHPANKYRLCCNEVYVRMDFTETHYWLNTIYRSIVQLMNALCCRLYLWVTKPFTGTLDRMLYLYFLFPWCFRKMLTLTITTPGKRKRI